MDYVISLAGNFGEPRPNHFHGGIDVKTDRVEGKRVLSVAEGFVSAVSIGVDGFGNAVYVQHPDGHTSIYCHLKRFSPRIESMVHRWQQLHQQKEGMMRFDPWMCPVVEGEMIALSGNTGSSQAPHLHLEIHDTRTWDMLDPLNFLGEYVEDHTPPQAHAFMAYPKAGEGVFNGGQNKTNYGFSSHNLTRKFTAWGKVGFGLWANDYMELTYNHYGIRRTELKVDGRTVFSSDVDGIPVQDNLMVNSWGDYDHYLRSNVWYMKSFIVPGNRLPILRADENNGYIDFNEERDYQITYVLSDFAGNTSEYSFVVTGVRQEIKPMTVADPRNLMRWDKTNCVSLPGMQLVIPYGTLDDDLVINPRRTEGSLSPSYRFTDRSRPLLGWGEISIKVQGPVSDTTRLYISTENGRNMGGEYHDGWVTGRIRDLGHSYSVKEDKTTNMN